MPTENPLQHPVHLPERTSTTERSSMPPTRPALLFATLIVGAFLAGAGATPALAAEAPVLQIGTTGGLTKPFADGFRDSVSFTIRSNSGTPVDVTVTDPATEEVLAVIAHDLVPTAVSGGYQATASFAPSSFAAGTFTATVADSAYPYNSTSSSFIVGSGEAKSVAVTASDTRLFPFVDGYRDSLIATVRVTDETGTSIPFVGAVDASAASVHSTVAISQTTGTFAKVTVPLGTLPLGPVILSTEVHTSVGGNKSGTPISLTLVATRVKKITVSRQYSTVYPKRDGYRDSVKLTVSTGTTAPVEIAAKGTLTIVKGGTAIKTWKLYSSKKTTVTWTPPKSQKAGTYTIIATLTNPDKSKVTTTASITVSSKKHKRKH
jgi:hypothetical protein